MLAQINHADPARSSGDLQRPRGRPPANMRWDDMRGWVRKDEAPSAGSIGQVSAPAAATAASAPPVVPADAPEAEISAGTSPAAAPTSLAGLLAANEALKAAAAVAAAAAADAAAASERAGVNLCRQHARVAVWAADGSISTESRLHEYEARRSAENWAAWALNAAALDQLDA